MTIIQEALARGSEIIHSMGNPLNITLHSCYEDAGVSLEQQKQAAEEIIDGYKEMQEIFMTLKKAIKDKGIK